MNCLRYRYTCTKLGHFKCAKRTIKLKEKGGGGAFFFLNKIKGRSYIVGTYSPGNVLVA